MRTVTRFILAAFAIISLCSLPAVADTLRAGVAQVDITPPSGIDMWGFAARKGTAIGTLDPLYSKVIVFATGQKRVAIVTLDLGRPFGPTSLTHLQDMVRKSSNISYVLVTASHTHSGPIVSDKYPGGHVPAWETAALSKIAEAVDSACRHLVPVRVGAGYGIAYVGYNRLQTKLDGTGKFIGRDPTQIVSSPIDPTVAILRVDTEDGQPLAILVNYACHPVVFGAENLRYSADFPAAVARTVNEAFPSHPICFFLQGAPGDIDPYYANTALQQDPDRWRNWTGKRVGDEAVRVAKTIETKAEANGSLDFADDTLTVEPRWDPAKFEESYKHVFNAKQFPDYYPHLDSKIALRTSTLLINKRIAFMTMPGEPFVNFQMDWRNRCPVHDTFFVGYANGYNGYFPTIDAAVRGGYGASSATTWAAVGSGERMVDHALTRIYELLGKLTDGPM